MCTYDLKYDDYQANITNGLQSFLATSEISDVTLAVEGKFFKVHQVILSIFSPYFRELFTMSPTRHAIVFMKNVEYRIMRDLLSFMYEGNVQILSEDLQLFMETAHELKIKGLTDEETNGTRTPAQRVESIYRPPRKAAPNELIKKANEIVRKTLDPKKKPILPKDICIKEEFEQIENNIEEMHELPVNALMQQNKRQADSTQQSAKKSKPTPKVPVQITSEVTALPVVASTSNVSEQVSTEIQAYKPDLNTETSDMHVNPFNLSFADMNFSMDEDVIELDEVDQAYADAEDFKTFATGEPVMVRMVRTKKGLALYANNYQYHRGDNSTYWTTWRCVRRISPQACTAILVLSRDGRAALKSAHNHAPCSAEIDLIGALAIQEHMYKNTTMEILNHWRLGMKNAKDMTA